jgi:hypothetical protein
MNTRVIFLHIDPTTFIEPTFHCFHIIEDRLSLFHGEDPAVRRRRSDLLGVGPLIAEKVLPDRNAII